MGTLEMEAVAKGLDDMQFVVVSNREPFVHRRQDGGIACIQPASGVTRALDPVLRATHGLWVAHGSGDADREVADRRGRVAVPPEAPAYTLKRVWLTPQQEERYYYGFANQAMWPLCHIAYQRPVFEEAHWEAYREVNHRFAEAIAQEIGDQRAFVFIQDYHFALLAGEVKRLCPKAVTATFWHIPWPNPEVFRICPWKEEILENLLANDMLGFHLRYHCTNFIESVGRFLEARVDAERFAVVYRGALTKIRAFPISVDFQAISKIAEGPETEAEIGRLRQRFGLTSPMLGVGLDRLDYTKGIPERFRAIDRFLERHPRYRTRFTFLQAGPPTRTRIPQYENAERQMVNLANEVNARHRIRGWEPIVFARQHFDPPSVYALYRAADLCIASSLHDGMNLVAKEFVAARPDEQGVLLLSEFTGAAREMPEAVLVNPYAIDEFAENIRAALEMSPGEAASRMRRMRQTVARHDIYRWATSIIRKTTDLAEEIAHEEMRNGACPPRQERAVWANEGSSVASR